MDFQTSIRTCLSKYATFSGRAQRSEFWFFALFVFAGNLILGLVDQTLFGAQALSALWSLALLLPSIAVAVRRLHDLGKSGWWYLIIFVPLLGLLVLIYWFIQKGTDGTNEYGPDPMGSRGYIS